MSIVQTSAEKIKIQKPQSLKIIDPKYIKKNIVDYLLILSWNLKNEIDEQEKAFQKKGGKFVIPFPKPKILK